MGENDLISRTFEENTVRTVARDNDTWWVAKDVCDILGIEQAVRSLENFPKDEVLKVSSNLLLNKRRSRGGASSYLTVNEPGLYRLIFQSRKPEAERFKHWVFHEVLPSIRKTGGYDTRDYAGDAKTAVGAADRAYKLIKGHEDRALSKNDRTLLLEAVTATRKYIYNALIITDALLIENDALKYGPLAERKQQRFEEKSRQEL